MTIILEVGKTYRTRSNNRVTIIEESTDNRKPMLGVYHSSGVKRRWSKDGIHKLSKVHWNDDKTRYFTPVASDVDIIAEVNDVYWGC